MTQFINPLDRVPQIRQDYANHLIYGGALSWLVAAIAHLSPATWPSTHAWFAGLVVTFTIAAAKKIADFYLENESLAMCVAKTFVTAAIPAWVLLLQATGLAA